MKREDVVRLRELLAKATPGPWSRYGYELADVEGVPLFGMHRERETDDAALVEAMHAALPALLALAEAVMDAPEGRVYVIGTGDGDDLLTIDPRDRQDRETVRDMAGTRVRLVAAPDGE